jgi:hypothetical protein
MNYRHFFQTDSEQGCGAIIIRQKDSIQLPESMTAVHGTIFPDLSRDGGGQWLQK